MRNLILALTNDEVQDFIMSHEHADVHKLLLGEKIKFGVPIIWLVHQIQGRKKSKEKLPLWYRTRGIIYPPSVNLAQSSSEATAKLKSNFVHGTRMADLSGGFGVDTYYFSKAVATVDYVEPDDDLLAIARHNHSLLGANNIHYHPTTAEDFLQSSQESFEFFFVDPSRRIGVRRTFHLDDSQPDVVQLKTRLLAKAPQTIIKCSPLLDLKQAFRELEHIAKFMVISSENECKELLIFLQQEKVYSPEIHAIDLNSQGTPTTMTFSWFDEKNAVAQFSSPQTFLYEPNAAILKTGAFKLIAQSGNVFKLAPDTHIYTSGIQNLDFPGRTFRILENVTLDKNLKKKFEGGYANILRRNYPLTVEGIRKKTGLREGGELYLICTRAEKPLAVIAERLK